MATESRQRLLAAALLAGVSLAVVALLSEVGLYQKLVFPHLPSIKSVPTIWWVGILTPLLLSTLVLGYSSCSIKVALASALGGTAGLIVYEFVMAYSNQPGHHKSWAIEAPLDLLVIKAPILFGIILFVTLMGFGTKRVINRREKFVST